MNITTIYLDQINITEAVVIQFHKVLSEFDEEKVSETFVVSLQPTIELLTQHV